jgi:hypothetical protein
MILCVHLTTDEGCGLGRYAGTVSAGVCARCQKYDGPARGAGDVLANAIKAATFGLVKPCGGCGSRQVALNQLLPSDVGRAGAG